MCGQFDRSGRLVERKLMRHKSPDIQLPRKNQPGDLVLEGEICRIAANEVLFIDANRRQVEGRLVLAPRMRKKQYLPAAAHKFLRLPHDGVGRNGDYSRI